MPWADLIPAAAQVWIVSGIILLLIYALAKNLASSDVLVFGCAMLMALFGIITPTQLFSGFANQGMMTVAALYIVAAALRETGALDTIGRNFLGKARTEKSVFVRLAASVTILSAFLNNTPIVAMFIPIMSGWSKANQVAISRLLLPLSYLTILGGTCTLIGTSTNLLVSGLMVQSGMEPLGFFELTWVGLPYAVVGTLYLYFIGRKLLRSRVDLLEKLGDRRREYLVNLRVNPNCPLINQEVEDAGLRRLPGLFLVEIIRGDEIITPVPPDQRLHVNDILTFTGLVDTLVDLERIPGLTPESDHGYIDAAEHKRDRQLHEAVISNTSPLIGKTIRDADFRARYNAAIIAVHRGATRLEGRVGDIELQSGDTLLLQAGPHFGRAHRNNPHFFLVSQIQDSRPLRHDKAILSLALLGILILLMATGVMPIVMAAFLIAGLMIATRCISASVARQSMDWQTLITIAAAFGLSEGLTSSGFVAILAGHIVGTAEAWGPYALLAAIYIMTSFFTELVTNNAAAAIMFPFAITMAVNMGIDPRPFAIAVALAASASFVSPLGYQTNLMVYGPGGYEYKDFVRVGLPLNLTLLVIAVLLIPQIWPFVS